MNQLYKQVLEKTRPYLADRSEVFLARQCNAHMSISPEQLTKEHLPELAKWVLVSASLMIKKELAEELKKNILGLNQ